MKINRTKLKQLQAKKAAPSSKPNPTPPRSVSKPKKVVPNSIVKPVTVKPVSASSGLTTKTKLQQKMQTKLDGEKRIH
jgi:hypothetical protein